MHQILQCSTIEPHAIEIEIGIGIGIVVEGLAD
jgi:hypothetical protein